MSKLPFVSASQPQLFVPPGHFYSPIPNWEAVSQDAGRIFTRDRKDLGGIDLRESSQLELLSKFDGYYADLPFPEKKSDGTRYYYDCPTYSYSDAICYYSMIRYLKPKRIIEVGSGHSSTVAMDTNELFFDNQIHCTFIEPHPQLLLSLLKPGDLTRCRLLESRLQGVPLEVFQTLECGDILFVDSTHVVKTGSDVLHLFFEILPRLAAGVHIHFHDIFYPFEYPEEWVKEGRAWNECYLLRAFLQFNSQFEIVLFNTFLSNFHRERFSDRIPLHLKNPGGSLWIKRNLETTK